MINCIREIYKYIKILTRKNVKSKKKINKIIKQEQAGT